MNYEEYLQAVHRNNIRKAEININQQRELDERRKVHDQIVRAENERYMAETRAIQDKYRQQAIERKEAFLAVELQWAKDKLLLGAADKKISEEEYIIMNNNAQ